MPIRVIRGRLVCGKPKDRRCRVRVWNERALFGGMVVFVAMRRAGNKADGTDGADDCTRGRHLGAITVYAAACRKSAMLDNCEAAMRSGWFCVCERTCGGVEL